MNNSSVSAKAFLNIRRLLLVVVGHAFITVVFYLIVYFVYGVWQALVGVGVLGATPVLFVSFYLLLRRKKNYLAGFFILTGLIIGYGVNELIWAGLLPYHIIGGGLLLVMMVHALFPRSYRIGAVFLGLYLVCVLLINRFEPLPRVHYVDLPVLVVYAIASNILVLTMFGGVMAYFAFSRTIRMRMMLLFVLLVGIPLIISSVISSYLTARISQNEVSARLEYDVVSHQTDIIGWLDSLRAGLQQRNLPPDRSSNELNVLSNKEPEFDYNVYRAQLVSSLGSLVENSNSILRIYILNLKGDVVYTTDHRLEGESKVTEDFFLQGLQGEVITPVYISLETQEPEFQIVFPIRDQSDVPVGVMVADIGFTELNQLIQPDLEASQTGETILFNSEFLLVSPSRFGLSTGEAYSLSPSLQAAMLSGSDGTGEYLSYREENVLGSYKWLQPLSVLLVVEKGFFEAFLPTIQVVLWNVIVTVLALSLSLLAAWYLSNHIASPINRLAQTANAVAAGNLSLVADVDQEDEVGALARAFNSMTAQLSMQMSQLEQRVVERTADLEQRSLQLQVAAEVARDASLTQDFDILLQRSVDLVRQRFGFYHAGIFLVDELGEYAVLRAATGEVGRQMIEKGHQLKLGEVGMVGFVASRGVPRIASDVEGEATHFQNPYLLKTRSEMALPLKVGNRVIGVLDVQSENDSAFTEDDAIVLQIMADQLAVAIENARLYGEAQASLHQVEALYGSYSQRLWQRMIDSQRIAGYQYDPSQGVSVLDVDSRPAEQVPAVIPLQMRGQVIANLRIYPSKTNWSESQQAVFRAIGERLSQAMESARLYQESQQSAANEQLVGEVTARMRETLDIDSILQTTIREIRQAFDLQEVEVRLDISSVEKTK